MKDKTSFFINVYEKRNTAEKVYAILHNFFLMTYIELNGIYRNLRRKCLMTFRKDYIEKQLKNRKGHCGNHGCCDLLILSTIRNRIMGCSDGYGGCKNWGKKHFPRECFVGFMDEKDKIPLVEPYCNHNWCTKTPNTNNPTKEN